MGNNLYDLIDLDNYEIAITPKEAVAGVKKTWIADKYQGI